MACRPFPPSASRQKYNDAAQPALDAAPHLPVVHVFDDLAHIVDEHPGCSGEATKIAWRSNEANNETHAVLRLSDSSGEWTGVKRPSAMKMDCSHVQHLRSMTHRVVICNILKALSEHCGANEHKSYMYGGEKVHAPLALDA